MTTLAAPRRRIILPMPHAGQRHVLRNARRFNVVRAGRRWRKSSMAAAHVAIVNALQGQRWLWFAPTYDQVRIGWGEMKKAAGGVAYFNETRMEIRMPGGGRITCRSLDNPDNARGHTADGVVFDEAQDIHPDAWSLVVRPMLLDTQGQAWFLFTPKPESWVKDLEDRALLSDDWAVWHAPTMGAEIVRDPDDPMKPEELVRAPHPLENTAIEWDEIVKIWNERQSTAAFEQEILAHWVTAGNVVFRREWWNAPGLRYLPEFAGDDGDALRQAAYLRRVVARICSWDTGLKDKEDNAYSAVVVADLLDDYRLVIREVWRERLTFPDLVPAITRFAARWRVTRAEVRQLDRDVIPTVVIEDKASGISAVQTLRRTAPDWLSSRIVAFPPSGDKQQRAEQAGVWCRNGCVMLPAPSPAYPWLPTFETELFSFPSTAFKDQVDAFAQLILHAEPRLRAGYQARERGVAA